MRMRPLCSKLVFHDFFWHSSLQKSILDIYKCPFFNSVKKNGRKKV